MYLAVAERSLLILLETKRGLSHLLFHQIAIFMCRMRDAFAKNLRTVAQHDRFTAHATGATEAAVSR